MFESPPCLVTCFVEGRSMTSEELREAGRLAEVAQALRAFHEFGLAQPTEFQVYDLVREYADVARSRGGEPPAAFEDALENAGKIVEAVEAHSEHQPRAQPQRPAGGQLPALGRPGGDRRLGVRRHG